MPPTTPPTIAPVCGLGGDEVVGEDEVVEPSVYLKGV